MKLRELAVAWTAFWQELTMTPAEKASMIYDAKTGTWSARR